MAKPLFESPWKNLAENGSSEAQYRLGLELLEANNDVEAFAWFVRASTYLTPPRHHRLVNPEAMYQAGIMQHCGRGTPQNSSEAFKKLECAGRADYAQAFDKLAQIHSGHGLSPYNPQKAIAYAWQAVEGGAFQSLRRLADIAFHEQDGGVIDEVFYATIAVLTLDPANSMARNVLAHMFLARGDMFDLEQGLCLRWHDNSAVILSTDDGPLHRDDGIARQFVKAREITATGVADADSWLSSRITPEVGANTGALSLHFAGGTRINIRPMLQGPVLSKPEIRG